MVLAVTQDAFKEVEIHMADTTGGRDASGGNAPLDPALIMQVGMGFWPSKALLSAVELGLFTTLGSGSLTGREIAERHGLRSRAVYDFLDGLVALRLLDRDGGGEEAHYHNTPETGFFLDATSPAPMWVGSWRWLTPVSTASGVA